MKILFVQDTDWIKRNPGQQHHLAERLVLRGHTIRVIDHALLWRTEGVKGLLSKRQVFDGVSKILPDANVTVIRPGIVKLPYLQYVSMVFTYHKELKKQLAEFQPNVVVTQSLLSNFLAVRLSKKHRIPSVYQMNDVNPTIIPESALRPLGRMLDRFAITNAQRVVVINEGLREYAIHMGAEPDNVHVIRAGIDLARYNLDLDGRKTREIFGINEGDTLLFFMGWLYHFSGLKEVVAKFSKIEDEYPSIKLMIVGDGDAFNELQRSITRLQLGDRIKLTGKQRYEEIPSFLAAADICILPAYKNDIMKYVVPIKMYEYMAMGKPVIATRLSGITKEFGDDNGVCYIDEPEDVLKKAAELVRTGTIQQQGEKARRFVQNNDWGRVVDEFEKVLDECM